MRKKFAGTPQDIFSQLSRSLGKRFPRARARPVAHVPGRMNSYEQAYSQELTARSDVAGWLFESIKLRLADNTFYTIDFFVVMADGVLELHEVRACRSDGKVLVEDDAQVKIKVAAEQYPMFTFRRAAGLRRKNQFQWKIDTYNTHQDLREGARC